MTLIKRSTQLAALLVSLACTSNVIAEDTNENSTDHIVSNANYVGNVSRNDEASLAEQSQAAPAGSHMKLVSDMDDFQKMEKEWYQQRRETYRQQQKDRSLQMKAGPETPADAQSRRDDYTRHMEERREFFNKLNEQRRKEFDQRRKEMQQKMHRTSNNSIATYFS